MDANQRKILELLAAGKLSVADAERLLDKMARPEVAQDAEDEPEEPDEAGSGEDDGDDDEWESFSKRPKRAKAASPERAKAHAPHAPRVPRFLRVHVVSEDGDNVNIRLPMTMIRAGVKLGALMPKQARKVVEAHGLNLGDLSELSADELPRALAELNVDIDDEDGNTVRVFCE